MIRHWTLFIASSALRLACCEESTVWTAAAAAAAVEPSHSFWALKLRSRTCRSNLFRAIRLQIG